MNDQNRRRSRFESIETKHMREREELWRGLRKLDRRDFFKVSAAAFGAVAAQGLFPPHTFQPITISHAEAQAPAPGASPPAAAAPGAKTGAPPAKAATKPEAFRIAYISDSHLYARNVNDRFINALM